MAFYRSPWLEGRANRISPGSVKLLAAEALGLRLRIGIIRPRQQERNKILFDGVNAVARSGNSALLASILRFRG